MTTLVASYLKPKKYSEMTEEELLVIQSSVADALEEIKIKKLEKPTGFVLIDWEFCGDEVQFLITKKSYRFLIDETIQYNICSDGTINYFHKDDEYNEKQLPLVAVRLHQSNYDDTTGFYSGNEIQEFASHHPKSKKFNNKLYE